MYRKILPLMLIGAPISLYSAFLALVALLTRTSRKSIIFEMTRGRNALVYLCIAMLLFTFAIWENPELFRLSGLMLTTLLLSIAVDHFRFTACFKFCVDCAFWFHMAAIALSIFLNKPLLLGGNEVFGRFGGLIGYDFVSFFVASYLVMQLYEDGRRVHLMTYVKLALGAVAIIQSGRFGYVNVAILASCFLLLHLSLKKILFSITVGAIAVYWFTDKFAFSYLSFQMFFQEILGNDVNNDLLISPDGYYGLSFRRFIAEIERLSTVAITPSFGDSFEVVDSGIVNTLGAAGWFLGSLVIVSYTRFINFSTLHSSSLSLILIVTDFKFRCFYSPFPMLWFFIMLKIMSEKCEKNLKYVANAERVADGRSSPNTTDRYT